MTVEVDYGQGGGGGGGLYEVLVVGCMKCWWRC